MRESVKEQSRQQHRPPLPRSLVRIFNPLLKLALNSPLHGGLSNRLMVLEFTGRKTGRRYSTPVGYVLQGESIFVFTHSAWRHNFNQPARVQMRIRGKTVTGTACLVSDPLRISAMIRALTAANGPELAQRMGFWVENLDTASPAAVQDATRGVYFIEITTKNGQ